jgi:hypothetical protein
VLALGGAHVPGSDGPRRKAGGIVRARQRPVGIGMQGIVLVHSSNRDYQEKPHPEPVSVSISSSTGISLYSA